MSTKTQEISNEMHALGEDARALLGATAGLAEEKVVETRKRLAAALENGKVMFANARERTIAQAKAADKVVHAHPYKTMGVAFGVGALLAFLLTRRH